ncbi:hypothetical protein CLONEX_02323 [[Clostridium] nexile DSM 1787]|nr:hypothetical protein CLONEX_02323 [[Clostridium] nexile DSM 1787]
MIHKTQKFNMKSERRAYREIYAFYFFCLFLKKVIKKLLTFCYWIRNIIFNKFEIWLRKRVFYMGIEYREERSGSKIQIFHIVMKRRQEQSARCLTDMTGH